MGYFNDLNLAGAWAQEAIVKAKLLGLVSGDPDGKFRPLDTGTRQEVAAILTRVLKLNLEPTTSSFSDVSSADWGFQAIEAVQRHD